MTDRCSRECGGEVNHSSSMSNPDPSRAALAHLDELIQKAKWIEHASNADQSVAGCHPLTYGDLVALHRHLPPTLNSGAVADIAAERHRQITVEGWTLEHDDCHGEREMAIAAACYALAPSMVRIEREWVPPDRPKNWPWHFSWWKPGFQRQNLIKAGALIVAEIERLDRASARRQS